MPYDFTTRLDILGTRMGELHDNSLFLTRDGEADVKVTNYTPEKTDVDTLAAYGLTQITEEAQDFVFNTSAFSSWTIQLPIVGDKIKIGTETYQVINIGDEVYKYTTSSKVRIRIHTKRIV